MRSWLLVILGILVSSLIFSAILYRRNLTPLTAVSAPSTDRPTTPLEVLSTLSPNPSPTGSPSVSPDASPSAGPAPDFTLDVNGLSKTTAVLNTTQGVIKFKFYPADAPKTVHRFAELMEKGFYNGLSFHRVIPGFVIQAGDPTGTGQGGSGQKLDAEFNSRKHVEGAIAMARNPQDPNSADSQFYITLGTHPHLDHNFTVFGQVIEGMDVAKKIKIGDKITSVSFQ